MKKVFLTVNLALSILFVTACSNNVSKETVSSKSEISKSSSTSTKAQKESSSTSKNENSDNESSTKSVASGLNITEIQSSNFSTLVGTWRNGQGESITFDNNGIVEPHDRTLDVSNSSVENGILKASLKIDFYGAMILFAPKGTTFQAGIDGSSDGSDNSKDRILVTQQLIYSDSSKFFYKVDSNENTASHKSSSVKEAIARKDTGVWLSGGDSSIDYANKILGYKERIVSHGNYGMTDEIPYSTVLSKDGQVYVYQNGVIISVDNEIMYEP